MSVTRQDSRGSLDSGHSFPAHIENGALLLDAPLPKGAFAERVPGGRDLRNSVTESRSASESFTSTRTSTDTKVQLLSVDDALVEMATELNRDFSLKTIDALHVASAIRGRADVFLTRDTGITRYPNLRSLRCEAIPL